MPNPSIYRERGCSGCGSHSDAHPRECNTRENGHRTLEGLVTAGMVDRAIAKRLARLVRTPNRILIAGNSPTGTRTLRQALTSQIPLSERVAVVQDSPSQRLSEEARASGILAARHMRPDWIVMDELRDESTLIFLLTLNSGHAGISTVHADNPGQAIQQVVAAANQSGANPASSVENLTRSVFDVLITMGQATNGIPLVSNVWSVDRRTGEYRVESI